MGKLMKIKNLIFLMILCLISCSKESSIGTATVYLDHGGMGYGDVYIKNYDHDGFLSDGVTFEVGTKITVVAVPDGDSEFKGWDKWESDYSKTYCSNDPVYTFVVTEDIKLIAEFDRKAIKGVILRISAAEGGQVEIKSYVGNSTTVKAGDEVTVIATPNENYDFEGWYVEGTETLVSNERVYKFTISEDTDLCAKFGKKAVAFDLKASGSVSGYDYVDLGLSVKWATYNIGANSIEEIGEYYAWGETTPYNKFTYNNYWWTHDPCSPDRALASLYDAATVNWSNQWRMPTYEEQEELINACEWVWVDNINGSSVSGYIGKSTKNGKCIFLPASKFASHNSYEIPTETDGVYWSATAGRGGLGDMGLQAGSTADCIVFQNPKMEYPVAWGIWNLCKGATIRPVVGTPNNYFPDPSTNVIDELETSKQGFTVNGKIDGHTYVDMGLPSRTMWATYNVGAELPSEYGEHFAWGETSPKETYSTETYKFFDGYSDAAVSRTQYTKYVYDRRFGKIDGKLILDKEDDAASVNWGEKWCMPTEEQYIELEKYCLYWRKDIEVDGKKIIGYVVESQINGNRIYFPAAGWFDRNVPNTYMSVWYWTSDLDQETNYRARAMVIAEPPLLLECTDWSRDFGCSVRAVVKK